MPYHYALANHGRTLATRPLGEELRADLIAKAIDQEVVVLDFSDIRSTSHSFADEFVACLADEARKNEISFDLTLTGMSEEVERVIKRALERRDVDLPALV